MQVGDGRILARGSGTGAQVSTATPWRMRFGHLAIEYDARVLRPRAWTADQSTWAADLLSTAPAGPVLELCCGAGHIGLLAVAGSQRSLVAVDANPAACEFARANAASAGLADRVEIREGDLRTAVGAEERFAVVIADPPYLPSDQTSRYPDDPVIAIDGGPDGMGLVWECLRVVARHLLPGGSAVLQLRSLDQLRQVADRVERDGGLAVSDYRDLGRGALARLVRTDP